MQPVQPDPDARKLERHRAKTRISSEETPLPQPLLDPNVPPGVTFACVRTGMPARLQGLFETYLDLNQSREVRSREREIEQERQRERKTPSGSHLCTRPFAGRKVNGKTIHGKTVIVFFVFSFV